MSADEALAILARLESEGVLAPCAASEAPKSTWANTVQGNALAMATAGRPLRRLTAEALLVAFLTRVRTVNAVPYYLYGVRSVTLFGSLLHGAGDVGDIDVVVQLEPKAQDAAIHRARMNERTRAATRQFRTIVEQVCWPRTEVERYLRGRSHRLSFVERLPEGVPSRIIYQCEGPFLADEPPVRQDSDAPGVAVPDNNQMQRTRSVPARQSGPRR